MAETLRIDFDILRETIDAYQKAYDDFVRVLQDISKTMTDLQGTKWSSAASQKYFEQYTEDWKTSFIQHLQSIVHLKGALEYAQKEYAALYDQIPTLAYEGLIM